MRVKDWSLDVCSSDLKLVAVRELDIAAHGVDLVCVDAEHDRRHAFGPTITVRIGAVEQGYMARRVRELDLLEHSLPYVGGQKIGTAGQGVAEVEVDCLGIGEDPAGLMVHEGRFDEVVEPCGHNGGHHSERSERKGLGMPG